MPGRLSRRLVAEFLGAALLVAVVVGSGIAAQRMTGDAALRLLVNSLATAAGLAVIILLLQPVSGAHLNPAVSLVDWWVRRRGERRPGGLELAGYCSAQFLGAVVGAVVANAMFSVPQGLSHSARSGWPLLLSEVIATAGLVGVIFGLALGGRAGVIPWAVGAWIGAAYWWTSSTSFANPAATVGRAFSDTYAGIAPSSVAPFVAGQLAGMIAGLGVVLLLVERVEVAADDAADPVRVPG
jgi:glycerol uptake facilitator-like aquaporin